MMTDEQVENAADEIDGFLQDAVGDMASGMIDFPDLMDDRWKKKWKNAKKNGVRDMSGWLADEIYNDVDSIQDLIGDRICDFTNGDMKDYNKVCEILIKDGHKALAKAAKNLMKE